MQSNTPPPSAKVTIDEERDQVSIEIPIDLFRSMQPLQLAGLETSSLFLTSTHAAEIRRIVATPKPQAKGTP